ncbi:MAG: ABC transporter ATP-binding protein [Xenococcaceae cyanobacterium MO_188.B32]|nr:ABC transporter ATP-binding protein [Xenococcaceae cyanobacterium MO_188.B32]
MRLELPTFIRKFVRANSFWRDNALLLRELKHFRWLLACSFLFTLISAALEGTTVGFIASFLQGLTNPNDPPIQTGIQWFDIWFLATNAGASERIYRLAGLILILAWLRSIFSYLGIVYSRKTSFKLAEQIRKSIFEQLQSLSLSYYSQSRSGEIINTIVAETQDLIQAFNAATTLITRIATMIAYLISLIWLSWQVSLAVVAMFVLLSLGLSNLVSWAREASFAVSKAKGNLASAAIELIDGIRTIKAFATEDFERKRFYSATNELTRAKTKVVLLSDLIKPLADGVATTILIAIVTIAFMTLVQKGELKAAELLTFMFVLVRMMPLVSQINSNRGKLTSFQGAISNIRELLSTKNKTYLVNGTIPFAHLNKSIDLAWVDFGYNPAKLVLHNITLSIKKGETTALIGASGAGKTTLVDLICRFYDPTRGKITIDGVDLQQLDINSLRHKMAIVSQDTFIFNTSVRNNIAYGLEGITDREIEQAAISANAWGFIKQLPSGLDTVLGDRGVRLSGGQRQRIAIARALLRNPEILVLDEATSALDSVTERLIQESLEKLSVGRTVIAIAHRLSTIVRADKIVVLEQGRIVEQGKYQELLEKQGKLWQYHQMQHSS